LEQVTLLVDPLGKWMLPGSEEFLTQLGDLSPDYDSTGYAVRNLGFIKFQVLDRLVVEIEVHPRNVAPGAVQAVRRQLATSTVKLFRIKHFDTVWRSEIYASLEHTLARLDELCTPSYTPSPSERFVAAPRDIAMLSGEDSPGMRVLAQKWRASFGNFDPSVMGLASRTGLLSLLVITGFDKGDTSPVLRFIGDGHRWASQQFQIACIGGKLEDTPDKEYGHWASEFHRAVATSGRPRYDLVTAATQIAQERGKPKRTLCYERLLLPWRTPSGDVLITSCAKNVGTDRSANLPDAPASSLAK